ncbi:hydrogenase biosynthesis protein HydE [Caminibacter profundus]
MILKFIFETPSTQGIIEKICIRVAKKLNIKLGLSRDLENIYAYVEGSEEELDNFSRELANELPLSIFLKSLNAEVTQDFKDDLNRVFPKISLPPCPKCLREVKDPNSEHFYNIFHHCEVCGYNVSNQVPSSKFQDVFKNLAKKLKEVGKISIQTMNGAYEISPNLENAEIIVARDLASVAKYFFAFEGDAKALASIEKPIVKLKTNLEFKKTYGLSLPAVDVKLPDCMVLELLFENIDIELLGLNATNNPQELKFDVEIQEIPRAVVTDSVQKDILLYSGDRGIIPKFEKYIKEGLVAKYKDYVAYSDNEKTILELKKVKEAKSAKPAFAGFYGVLTEWELENKTIFGFCFYKKETSKIFINSPKFGLVEYIDFKFYFSDFKEIFALIAAMNDTGKKLIENFSKKESQLFENALNADISADKKGIYYLWGLIGIVLGFGKNIDEAANKLLKYANLALTKKGPRIDYKLEGNNLNPLWAIRTAMSFHLAGVDNYLLSYGVVESFAEFLSNTYDEVNKDTPLDGAVIVGDLFDGEFLNKIYSYISKNYPVFTPRALPISGAIEAFGSLVINSKVN